MNTTLPQSSVVSAMRKLAPLCLVGVVTLSSCLLALPAGGATIVKVVTDTFTGPNSSNLGTTEDASQIPWAGVGAGGAAPTINNNKLNFISSSDDVGGPSAGDVGLGAMQAYLSGYKVKNLRLDVDFTPNSPIGPDDKWVAVQWRKTAGNGSAADGFLFLVNKGGWWSVQTNGVVAASGFVAAWTQGATHTLSIVVTNNSHTVKYDGLQLTNINTSFNPNAGYVSLMTYHYDTVIGTETFDRSFDDFDLSNDDIFRVEDYGAIPGDSSNDGPAIRQAIAAAKAAAPGTTVLFEHLAGGDYLVTDGDPLSPSRAFYVANANGLTIHGNNSARIINGVPTNGVFFFGTSTNCAVRGFNVDYSPLPFTQGRIVAKTATTFDVLIEEPAIYPAPNTAYFDTNQWGMIYEPAVRLIKANAPDAIFINGWLSLGNNTYRFTAQNTGDLNYMSVNNDRFVYLGRASGFPVYFWKCTNSTAAEVTVYSSPCIAYVADQSTGITFTNCNIRYLDTSRLIANNRDGIHCQGGKVGPLITGCYIEGLGDDCINMRGRTQSVFSEVQNDLVVNITPEAPIAAGDRLQIVHPADGQVRLGTVQSVVTSGTNWQVTFTSPVTGIAAADMVFNLDFSLEGYRIQNNVFASSRRHAALLRSGNGLMENNAVTNMGGGIFLVNEFSSFLEGPVPYAVTVRSNIVDTPGRTLWYKNGGIHVATHQSGGLTASQGYGVTNVILSANEIINSPQSIYVGAATNVSITGATITNTAASPIMNPTDGIVLERVGGVQISSTSIQDTRNDGAQNGPLHAGIYIKHTTPNVPGTNGVYIGSGVTYNLPYYRYQGLRDER